MIESVKLALRITHTALDIEIEELIDACKVDLSLAGILQTKIDNETDPLIRRAVVVYCKANFGFDNPDFDRLTRAYELLKMSMAVCIDYTEESDVI